MESLEARDLLIEFAQAYESVQIVGIDDDRKEALIATLVRSTRVILRALIAREPTEEEIEDVLPL